MTSDGGLVNCPLNGADPSFLGESLLNTDSSLNMCQINKVVRACLYVDGAI